MIKSTMIGERIIGLSLPSFLVTPHIISFAEQAE
jgi:hypothetical protein